MRSEGDVNYAANPYGMPPDRPQRRRALPKSLLLTVAGVTVFAGGVLIALSMSGGKIGGGPPPMIEADATPTKSRPPETGQEDASPPDRLVYERLSGATRPSVERLLPPPEQPLPRPIVAAEPERPPPAPPPAAAVPPPANMLAPPGAPPPQNAASNAAGQNPPGQKPGQPPAAAAAKPGQQPPPAANGAQNPNSQNGAAKPGQQPAAAPPPAAKPGQPPAAPPQNAATAAPQHQPQNAQHAGNQKTSPQQGAAPAGTSPTGAAPGQKPGQQVAASPIGAPQMGAPPSTLKAPGQQTASVSPPPAHSAAASSGGGGSGWRVQLASVRTETEAAAEWRRLQSRYPGVLGGMNMQVAKVDLGDKGVFYRVQGGGVDEGRARNACEQLRSQNVGCVVVKP